MYLSVSLSSVTACWASKPFLSAPPRLRECLQFKWLIFWPRLHKHILDMEAWASVSHARTNTPTPGVFVRWEGVITAARCIHVSQPIKTKQDASGDFIRRAMPHTLSAPLSHASLPPFFFFVLSVNKPALTYKGGFWVFF